MTTLAQLADECQNTIADAGAGTWSQATVEEWVKAGIRLYSQNFPRQITSTIATSAADHTYNLPTNFQAMVTVEYPTDQDPKRYLKRRSHKHPSFWLENGYYDVMPRGAEPALSSYEDELWISDSPAASETITITYLGDHASNLSSGSDVTVPGRHFNILINYVVWQAWRERTGAEEKDPETTTLQLSQFQANANAAEQQFRDSLAEAVPLVHAGGYTGPWVMDKHDRIY
ncbi:MAG: hypothetical protein AB1791_20360 [Chloroflexota bacterium]